MQVQRHRCWPRLGDKSTSYAPWSADASASLPWRVSLIDVSDLIVAPLVPKISSGGGLGSPWHEFRMPLWSVRSRLAVCVGRFLRWRNGRSACDTDIRVTRIRAFSRPESRNVRMSGNLLNAVGGYRNNLRFQLITTLPMWT